ncbi:MAG: hypothetical protein AABX30_01825 [Nanoarchaeota archaeon]
MQLTKEELEKRVRDNPLNNRSCYHTFLELIEVIDCNNLQKTGYCKLCGGCINFDGHYEQLFGTNIYRLRD